MTGGDVPEKEEVPEGTAGSKKGSDPHNLHTVFQEGGAIVERLEDMDSGSKEFAEAVARGMAIFQDVASMVSSLGLISPNEELEDIGTSDLKFILVDYYLSQLWQRAPGQREQRWHALRKAMAALDVFLGRCRQIGLLAKEDLKAWEGEGEHDDEGEEEGGAIGSSRARRKIDPVAQREVKIERYRREKAAKERMRDLIHLLQKLSVGGKDGDEAQDASGEKEELERERVIVLIGICVRKALDDRDSMKQELEILDMMRRTRLPEARGGAAAAPTVAASEALGAARKAMTVTHVDSVGGQLRIRQEEIKARVFQPGYRLPTMTLDELAEIELKQAKEAEERAKKAPKPVKKYAQLEADGEEDDEELVEKAAYKDREWDDWKDEHPRGMGNKAGKIF